MLISLKIESVILQDISFDSIDLNSGSTLARQIFS